MVKVRSKVQRSELCYTSAMSRFLALLVALVIPFQAVAAIAAGYCEAEPPSISHPGHHAHVTNDYVLSESELGALQPADSAQKASATVDASLAGSHHCGISHFGCNIAMIATATGLVLDRTVFFPVPEFSLLLPSPLPDQPERPKWADLA